MPTQADDPLRKVTLNLYAADCDWLIRTYGRDWTVRVRQHISAIVHERKHSAEPTKPIAITRRTLGDLG